jgi:hypothetical protein
VAGPADPIEVALGAALDAWQGDHDARALRGALLAVLGELDG